MSATRPLLLLIALALLAGCAARRPAPLPEGADTLAGSARKAFVQGYAAATGGQPALALQHFALARRQAPAHPPLLLNIALAHDALGQPAATAGWFNAWLATAAGGPRRADVERRYRQALAAARSADTAALQAGLRALFGELPGLQAARQKQRLRTMALDMAAAGDIYGALQLLAEAAKPGSGLHPGGAAALDDLRDEAWRQHALLLAWTGQGAAAERARANIGAPALKRDFWWRLATDSARELARLPPVLRREGAWLARLAEQSTPEPAERERLALHNRRLPPPARSPLLARSLQLAELLAAAPAPAAPPEAAARAALARQQLLFLLEALAAERGLGQSRHSPRPSRLATRG